MYKIEKVLDSNNNILGYQTNGLKNSLNKELKINLNINKKIAKTIFDKMANASKIESEINNITNMPLKIVENDDFFIIVFPDENGLFPNDTSCNDIFKKQLE